jgi:hypothetical protein
VGAQSPEHVWWDFFGATQMNYDVFQNCFEHVQSKVEHGQTHCDHSIEAACKPHHNSTG